MNGTAATARRAGRRRAVVRACVAALALLGAARCDGEARGTVQVSYRLLQQSGLAQSCADLGAESLELSFFAAEEDALPFDVATVPCDASASGRGSFALVVAQGRYARVELKLVTNSGNIAHICTDEGRVPAVVAQRDIAVDAGMLCNVEFEVIGDSTPCTE